MFLLDDSGKEVDAEFSLDLLEGEHCVVVESAGGSTKGQPPRNRQYNKLMGILLTRLGKSGARLTRVILDSAKVAHMATSDRIAKLDVAYPVDLAVVDVEKFRKMLGRTVAGMHQDPASESAGNSQKRIRLCIDRPIDASQLVVGLGNEDMADKVPDHSPSATETERRELRAARRGQGKFRKELLERFESKCPLLGVSNVDLLVASHIKPWSDSNNFERLDPENGILLSAMMDRLFDKKLITLNDDGGVLVSPRLSLADRKICGLDAVKTVTLTSGNRRYLEYHRKQWSEKT